ncbi:hypothetical protein [Amycolatopsis sp. NPDC051128]|uniref:caspase family protein n=1 Tax=Amycolatopsis sp. NPDC051128 TaxID=3155412 RepID=UPI00341D0592
MSSDPRIPDGSRAILIGVPRYEKDARYRSYTAVGNSVEGMYKLLVESSLCGWREEQVEKIINPANAGQLMGRLRQLAAETTGVLLLYFVGHGQPSEHTGELCLAITDTDHANPDATGLEYSKIKRMLHSGTPAATRIVILDCCYSGIVIGGLGPDDLADLSDCAGAYTLTAADERARVPLDDQGNPRTAFTGELLDLLARDGVPDGPPGLTLGKIFPLLRQRLMTKGLPRPNQRSDDSVAAFVFARNAAGLAGTAVSPTAAATHVHSDEPADSGEPGTRDSSTGPLIRWLTRHRVFLGASLGTVLAAAAAAAVVFAMNSTPPVGPPTPKPSTTVQPSTFTLSGTFTIKVSSSDVRYGPLIKTTARGCYGTGVYADISAGTAVVITDPEGQQVGVGALQYGQLPNGNSNTCVMPFSVPGVPRGLPSYSITISHRGTQVETPQVAQTGVALGLCPNGCEPS